MKRALGAVLLLSAVALSGCATEEDDGEGFSVRGPDADGIYTFTARTTADEYQWDLGDRLSRAQGKTVKHAYDFTDGTVTVRLTAISDGESRQFHRELVVGSGENTKPALVLEAQTNWTVPGERVRFSGAASSDPDNDQMRFSWNCIRDRDAVFEQTPHVHAGGGGVPFATPGSGSGASRLAVGELPAPQTDLGDDLCAAMQGTGFSTNATVEGAFAQTGVYDITLIGSDGPNPTISTRFTVYVTEPEQRPAASQTYIFRGTLLGGRSGSLEGVGSAVCQEAGDNATCDEATYQFKLPLDAHVVTVSLEHNGGVGGAGTATFETLRSGSPLHEAQAEPWSATDAQRGTYQVRVSLDQGAQISYTLQVEADLKMAPALYFA